MKTAAQRRSAQTLRKQEILNNNISNTITMQVIRQRQEFILWYFFPMLK